MQENITIVTGSPATGKSTISRSVAEMSYAEKSVHIHTDDFYGYLVKGRIAPHKKEASGQNEIVMNAFLSVVKEFYSKGYHVIVDGIVGPWSIEPWRTLSAGGYRINYFILRATKEETMKRALNRFKLTKEENIELVESMWPQFTNLEKYEKNIIDTTNLTVDETAEKILGNIQNKTFLL